MRQSSSDLLAASIAAGCAIRRIMRRPLTRYANTAATLANREGTANLQPVRIVTDPDAPALQPQDVDRLYPWRQKDLVRELNRRLGRRMLNSYDIQAVRRHHQLDERPDFVFNLAWGRPPLQPAAADWIMDRIRPRPRIFPACAHRRSGNAQAAATKAAVIGSCCRSCIRRSNCSPAWPRADHSLRL